MENKRDNILIMSWKLKKLYEKMFASVIEELKLTQNEIDVLLFLHNNKPLDTAKDIVEYRAISKSLISKSTDSLIKKGLLDYGEDKGDKRCIHLKIQPSAAPIIDQLRQVQKQFFSILYTNVTSEEEAVIEKVLKKIQQNAANAMNKELN